MERQEKRWSFPFASKVFNERKNGQWFKRICILWLCFAASRILVPWSGIKPTPPALGVWNLLTLEHWGSPLILFLKSWISKMYLMCYNPQQPWLFFWNAIISLTSQSPFNFHLPSSSDMVLVALNGFHAFWHSRL